MKPSPTPPADTRRANFVSVETSDGKVVHVPTDGRDLPEDPVRRARFVAIRMAGGTVAVSRAIGRKNHETVRRWYVDSEPSAANARTLVKLCDGVVKLAEILPDVFGGLTVAELGYVPADAENAAP